jgi:hypothetical protein
MSYVYSSEKEISLNYTEIMFRMISAFIVRRGEFNVDGPASQDYLIGLGDGDVRCLRLKATYVDSVPRIELFSYSRISIERIGTMGNPLVSPFIVSTTSTDDFIGLVMDPITIWTIPQRLMGIFEKYLKCMKELNDHS